MKVEELSTDWSTGLPAGWGSARATFAPGAATITTTADGLDYAGHITSPVADLTGSGLVLELRATPPGTAPWETLAQLVRVNGPQPATRVPDPWTGEPSLILDALFWRWSASNLPNGRLDAGFRAGGRELWVTGDAGLPFDPTAHRWLRIRDHDGMVRWDTSPDGATWTERAGWAPSFPITELAVVLRYGHTQLAGMDFVALQPIVYGPLNPPADATPDPVTMISGDGLPYLAVDVVPDLQPGTFMLGSVDSTDGSVLDGPDMLAWAAVEDGAWVNVVCDVTDVQIGRGSTRLQGVLTRAEAGECTVTLTDTDRRFDPLANADAIHTNTPVRVRAWGYGLDGERWDAVLFTGRILNLPVRYRYDEPPEVTISATDLIGELAGYRAPGLLFPTGGGDDLLGRARRWLAEIGASPDDALSWDVDPAGYAASHPPTVLSAAWDELVDVQDAELGRLWVDRGNRLVVRNRRSELSGTVRGTLSDLHGDALAGTVHCCYDSLDAALGVEQTTNRAVGARRRLATEDPDANVATVDVVDAAAAARWGWRVTERRSLELQTDPQTAAWAEHLVATQSEPELRVDAVSPAPSSEDLDSALAAWPAVCATDLGDRWVVRYRPPVGQPVDRTVGVLGVRHSITPDSWTVLLITTDAPGTSPGNPSGYFLLDVSELDSGDVLSALPQDVAWDRSTMGGGA